MIRLEINVVVGFSAWRHGGGRFGRGGRWALRRYAVFLLPLAFLPFLGTLYAGSSWLLQQIALVEQMAVPPGAGPGAGLGVEPGAGASPGLGVAGGPGLGLAKVLMALVFAGMMLFTLIVSLPYIINVFYLNDDLEILLPLPIPPWQVVAAKFAVVWAGEWGFTLLFLGPFIAAWLVSGPVNGILPTVYAGVMLVLLTALLPVLPLAVGALVAIAFMRVVSPSRGRFKEYMQVFGAMLGILVALGFNLVTQRVGQMNPQEIMERLTRPGGMVELTTRYLPPARWAVWLAAPDSVPQAVTGGLLLVGATVLAVALVGAFAQRWYLTGLLGETRPATVPGPLSRTLPSSAPSSRPASRPGSRPSSRPSSVPRSAPHALTLPRPRSWFAALFLKEWLVFWRTPGFAMYGLVTSLAIPVSMLLVFFFGAARSDLTRLLAELPELTAGLPVPLAPILAGGLTLFTAFNPILIVGFSREGHMAWHTLVLPLRPWQTAASKVALAGAVAAIPLVAFALLAGYVLRLPATALAVTIAWGIALNATGQALALAVDFMLPKLEWKNPMYVAQNSIGGFLAMVAAVLPVLILGGLGLCLWYFDVKGTPWAAALLTATALLAAVAGLLLSRAARYRLERAGI